MKTTQGEYLRMWKNIFLVLFLMLSGCATQYEIYNAGNEISLNKNISLLLVCGNLGTYGDNTYPDSAKNLVRKAQGAFSEYLQKVEVNINQLTLQKALYETNKKKLDYLIYINIIHWEDRATYWSGIRDTAEIKLRIYDSRTNEKNGGYVISGKGTIWRGALGHHPQHIFKIALDKLASDLVTPSQKASNISTKIKNN